MTHSSSTMLPAPLQSALIGANHVDVKTIQTRVPLRVFVAGFISYMPAWIQLLYAVRWGVVRLLGMHQDGIPRAGALDPDSVPMRAGERLSFFAVEAAEDERFWIAVAKESHLSARLGIVATPNAAGDICYQVYTIVHYHRWTGPVYFNLIRPFHHLVVGSMLRAGAKAGATP
jgi:hypothetical protein